MFDRLKSQVSEDVQIYNHTFSDHQSCRAQFASTADSFRVEVADRAVEVSKQPGSTVIDIKYDRPEGVMGGFDHLEVAPGDHGQIGYLHKGTFTTSDGQISEHILDSVLC